MSVSFWLLALGVVAVAVAIGVRFVHRRARELSDRTRAIRDDALEPRSTFPSLVSVPAVHLRTVFARESIAPLLEGFPAGIEVALEVSESEVVLRSDDQVVWIPLTRMSEAVFVNAFESQAAPDGGALLRLTWRRGGALLWTVFQTASWVDAEKVRQQLHMRLGNRP